MIQNDSAEYAAALRDSGLIQILLHVMINNTNRFEYSTDAGLILSVIAKNNVDNEEAIFQMEGSIDYLMRASMRQGSQEKRQVIAECVLSFARKNLTAQKALDNELGSNFLHHVYDVITQDSLKKFLVSTLCDLFLNNINMQTNICQRSWLLRLSDYLSVGNVTDEEALKILRFMKSSLENLHLNQGLKKPDVNYIQRKIIQTLFVVLKRQNVEITELSLPLLHQLVLENKTDLKDILKDDVISVLITIGKTENFPMKHLITKLLHLLSDHDIGIHTISVVGIPFLGDMLKMSDVHMHSIVAEIFFRLANYIIKNKQTNRQNSSESTVAGTIEYLFRLLQMVDMDTRKITTTLNQLSVFYSNMMQQYVTADLIDGLIKLMQVQDKECSAAAFHLVQLANNSETHQAIWNAGGCRVLAQLLKTQDEEKLQSKILKFINQLTKEFLIAKPAPDDVEGIIQILAWMKSEGYKAATIQDLIFENEGVSLLITIGKVNNTHIRLLIIELLNRFVLNKAGANAICAAQGILFLGNILKTTNILLNMLAVELLCQLASYIMANKQIFSGREACYNIYKNDILQHLYTLLQRDDIEIKKILMTLNQWSSYDVSVLSILSTSDGIATLGRLTRIRNMEDRATVVKLISLLPNIPDSAESSNRILEICDISAVSELVRTEKNVELKQIFVDLLEGILQYNEENENIFCTMEMCVETIISILTEANRHEIKIFIPILWKISKESAEAQERIRTCDGITVLTKLQTTMLSSVVAAVKSNPAPLVIKSSWKSSRKPIENSTVMSQSQPISSISVEDNTSKLVIIAILWNLCKDDTERQSMIEKFKGFDAVLDLMDDTDVSKWFLISMLKQEYFVLKRRHGNQRCVQALADLIDHHEITVRHHAMKWLLFISPDYELKEKPLLDCLHHLADGDVETRTLVLDIMSVMPFAKTAINTLSVNPNWAIVIRLFGETETTMRAKIASILLKFNTFIRSDDWRHYPTEKRAIFALQYWLNSEQPRINKKAVIKTLSHLVKNEHPYIIKMYKMSDLFALFQEDDTDMQQDLIKIFNGLVYHPEFLSEIPTYPRCMILLFTFICEYSLETQKNILSLVSAFKLTQQNLSDLIEIGATEYLISWLNDKDLSDFAIDVVDKLACIEPMASHIQKICGIRSMLPFLLSDKSFLVRRGAVKILSTYAYSLEEQNEFLQLGGVDNLMKCSNHGVGSHVVKILEKVMCDNPTAKSTILVPRYTPTFIYLLKMNEMETEQAIIQILLACTKKTAMRVKDPKEIITFLLALLNDKDIEEKKMIVELFHYYLVNNHTMKFAVINQAVPALLRLSADKDPTVRFYAEKTYNHCLEEQNKERVTQQKSVQENCEAVEKMRVEVNDSLNRAKTMESSAQFARDQAIKLRQETESARDNAARMQEAAKKALAEAEAKRNETVRIQEEAKRTLTEAQRTRDLTQAITTTSSSSSYSQVISTTTINEEDQPWYPAKIENEKREKEERYQREKQEDLERIRHNRSKQAEAVRNDSHGDASFFSTKTKRLENEYRRDYYGSNPN